MTQETDFKKLQVRTYQFYQQDGLIDIIIGLMIIGFGLNMAFDNSAFLFMGWLPIILYVPVKNRITVPRIGYVKFYASNKIVFGLVIAGLLVLMLGMIVFLISGPDILSPGFQVWLRQYYMLLLGVVAALCFFGAGALTGISRLYVYAVLFLVIFLLGTWLNILPAIYVILTGGFVEVVGIWMMVRFLRKYPIAERVNAHE
jgi:hypothetical protein